MNQYNIAIIGGGASGMMAAITAKRLKPGLSVLIIDRMSRIGKKLLATGNGRCNYTNVSVSPDNYYGSRSHIESALSQFSNRDTIDFFSGIGIVARTEDGGKVYPHSLAAASVLDALRFELDRLGVDILTETEVTEIHHSNREFKLRLSIERLISAKRLIIATGGKASPSLGSNGSGYSLLTSLGHSLTPLSPALVQLKSDASELAALQGIKVDALVSGLSGGKPVYSERGDLLFTRNGFSGPPVFQLSAKYADGQIDELFADLCPDIREDELHSLLRSRRSKLSHLTAENFFLGFINKRVGNLVFRRSVTKDTKLSLPVSKFTDHLLDSLALNLKALRFSISGTEGWENAQVTAGGIKSDEFDSRSLESKLCPGLYASGEVLDIYGDCGGYNLQWAWSSGFIAGQSAALKA